MEDLLHCSLPLIRPGRNHRKLLVAPIRRYTTAPCCENLGHITNFKRSGYQSNMVDTLEGIRDRMRRFYYNKRILNFRICSSEKPIGWEEETTFEKMNAMLGLDLVHLSTAQWQNP